MTPIILSVVWYKILPAQFGGQKGIANFNQSLGRKYPLVCLCSKDNEPPGGLTYKVLAELPSTKRQFFDPICLRKIKSAAKKENATHIILEHPYHGIAAIKASRVTGAKLIVHSHNIESERYKQLGKWWWRILYRYEKWVHRHADLNLFKTENEMNYAITHFKLDPGKCMVIPYGIDVTGKTGKSNARLLINERHSISPNSKILLFAGTLDYEPNAKAVENIYKEIAPRLTTTGLDFKIIICGRNRFPAFQYLKKLAHPAVILAGETDDIEPYFLASDVFINPVQTGGGIQTKNIDALGHNLNVVCFNNMLSGIDAGLTAGKIFPSPQNDWTGFIDTINKALQAAPVAISPAFFTHYSFDTQAEKLAARLNSL
ncbi:MAG: glycosyltransferase [Chitinophagaceae bacterium]